MRLELKPFYAIGGWPVDVNPQFQDQHITIETDNIVSVQNGVIDDLGFFGRKSYPATVINFIGGTSVTVRDSSTVVKQAWSQNNK